MLYEEFKMFYPPIISHIKRRDNPGTKLRFWNFLRAEMAEYVSIAIREWQGMDSNVNMLGEILSRQRILRTVSVEMVRDGIIDLDAIKINLDLNAPTPLPKYLRFPLVYRPCPNCGHLTTFMPFEGIWQCVSCKTRWVDEFYIPEKVLNVTEDKEARKKVEEFIGRKITPDENIPLENYDDLPF